MVVDALMDAVKCGDLVALRALLTAAPHLVRAARSATGESPVLVAVYRGRVDIALFVGARTELDFFEAAAVGHVGRLAECLLEDPSNVSARTEGWTALHLAAMAGQPATCKALLDVGADPNAVSANNMESTPLHTAVGGATNVAVVELLVAHGASVTARAAGGVTPLHNAASKGALAITDTLIDHGADPTVQMNTGQTPAMIATAKGHTQLARRLRTAERARV
jgi:uncharacterized protein